MKRTLLLVFLAFAAFGARAGEPAHVAVCVGVNKYDTDYVPRDNWLKGCVADASNLWTNLTQRGEWTPGSATLLLDGAATKAAIRAAITNAAAAAAPGDVFVYTHSSHGYSWPDEETGAYTVNTGLCAYDGDYEDFELAADLAKFPSGAKVVVFVDACHSGGLFKAKRKARARTAAAGAATAPFALAERVGAAIDAIRAAEPVRRGGRPKGISSDEIGWVTAADYNQYSWDSEKERGGEFTTAAIQGWRTGACDVAPCGDEDCYANFYELWNYAKDIAVGHDGEEEVEYPWETYRTDAQCFNTNVLRSVRAGWVGDEPPSDVRFVPIPAQTVTVGEQLDYTLVATNLAGVAGSISYSVESATAPSGTYSLDGADFTFAPASDGRFTFSFRATNATAGASAKATMAVSAVLAAPTDVASSGVAGTSFTASWGAVAGATSYLLVVADNDFGVGGESDFLLSQTVSGTSFAVDGLLPGTYYWHVCAVGNSSGPFSETEEVTLFMDPSDPPFIPSIGDIAVSVGQTATATVRVAAPEAAPVTSLEITEGDSSARLDDGLFSFTPEAVGTYSFTITAVNANGPAQASFSVVATLADLENLRAGEVGPDSVEVLWDAVAGADGYWVEVDEYDADGSWGGTVFDDDVGDVTQFVATGLKPETEYEVTVWAYAGTDDDRLWSYDDWISVTTDKPHVAPSWSAVAAPAAQAGRPYRLDLAPFANGYPAPVLSVSAGDATLEGATLCFVPAATGTSAFTVVASNDVGTASATFEVAVEALAPKKFAVCVGINKYAHISPLSGCVNDAKFMAANLEERGGWEPADVTVLLDSAATKASIRGAISNVAVQAMSGDTFVYQHSSHGGQFYDTTGDLITNETGKATFLCVYDEDYDDNTTAYNDYEIADDLAAFPSGVKVAVIVDACHSGGLFKSRAAARAAAAAFDLAGRVSAHMDAVRTRRRARGENVARSLAASEVGWATAAEYYEYSLDGGFYHTDAWLSDPSYGDEWWAVDSSGDFYYDCPDSYRQGGVFLCSSTWGWWSGDADADKEAGDGDGLCDVYEFWVQGSNVCAGIGTFWYDDPEYNFHPQCTNVAVLRSVELGWISPPGDPIPAFPPDSAPERIASSLAGSADSALVEHVSDADAYSAYRAWAQTVKPAGGSAPAGAAAVRGSPHAWFSFALGSDALLPDDFGSDDVHIAAFGPADDAGVFAFEVEIDGVDIGSSAAVTEETLLENLTKAFTVEGAETPDPDEFSPAGVEVWLDSPAGNRVRLEAAPPDDAGDAFFFRVKLH